MFASFLALAVMRGLERWLIVKGYILERERMKRDPEAFGGVEVFESGRAWWQRTEFQSRGSRYLGPSARPVRAGSSW